MSRIRVIQRVREDDERRANSNTRRGGRYDYEFYDVFDGQKRYSLSAAPGKIVPLLGEREDGTIVVEKFRDLRVRVDDKVDSGGDPHRIRSPRSHCRDEAVQAIEACLESKGTFSVKERSPGVHRLTCKLDGEAADSNMTSYIIDVDQNRSWLVTAVARHSEGRIVEVHDSTYAKDQSGIWIPTKGTMQFGSVDFESGKISGLVRDFVSARISLAQVLWQAVLEHDGEVVERFPPVAEGLGPPL